MYFSESSLAFEFNNFVLVQEKKQLTHSNNKHINVYRVCNWPGNQFNNIALKSYVFRALS